MSFEADVHSVLSPLVAGRAYPNTFPQDVAWPALRFTFIDVDPDVDICGDGGDETAQIRVQVDGVDKTYMGMRALRASVLAAMKLFPNNVPAIYSNSFDDYESVTKAHRCSLDFILQPSSA